MSQRTGISCPKTGKYPLTATPAVSGLHSRADMAALIETVGCGPIGDFELFDHFVGAIGNEPVCLTKRARAPHRGYSGIPRQVVNTDYIGDDERVLANVQRPGLAPQRFNRRSKIACGSNIQGVNVEPNWRAAASAVADSCAAPRYPALASIASRLRPGMISRRSAILLETISLDCSDNPVTLPPGRARLLTKPLASGSTATANTTGIAEVACLTAGIALPAVMTSTFCRTNSAAI